MKEKMNKILFLFFFSISIRTVPKMELFICGKIMVFGTSHERGFLVFGVSNAKHLIRML